MQTRHLPYMRHVWQPPNHWTAHPNATPEAPPLPRVHRTAARTVQIREIFLIGLHGRATLTQVLDACCKRGLLDELNDVSAPEIVKRALRPIATSRVGETARARVHAQVGLGRGAP